MTQQTLQRLAVSATLLLLSNAARGASDNAAIVTPKATATAAARFLEQAAFGPTPLAVSDVQAMGMSAWIDSQIALDKTKWSPIPDPAVDAKGNTSLAPTQDAFFLYSHFGQDQLRQRVAFALGQIWVTSGVKLAPEAIVPYQRLLQADAFATFDKIMYDVTVSPAMGHYLDMVNNNKATAGHSPNENYAREILQLFTLGLYQLDAYGRVMKDSRGVPIPSYSQDVIEGFAAAFTGWTYAPKPGATSHFGNPSNWTAPMVAFEANHDKTAKVLLNIHTLPANQSADADLKAALDNIFQHANVGPFICRQLIQRLVTSSPSDAYVKRISDVFNQKPRGSMAAVVKAILLDPDARKGDDGSENIATKLREPALWISAFLRGLNAQIVAPNSLPAVTANLGQNVYYSPTVFNYFHNGYEISLSSSQTYNAPEFELLSEATAAAAADLVNTLVFGSVNGVAVDLTPYITPLGAKPGTAEIGKLLDALNTNLMGGRMPTDMRATIIKACAAQTTPKAMAQTAVYLIGSSWNYQVER